MNKTDIKAASKGWDWKEPEIRKILILVIISGIVAIIGEVLTLVYLPADPLTQGNIGFGLFMFGFAGLAWGALMRGDRYKRMYEEKCNESRE